MLLSGIHSKGILEMWIPVFTGMTQQINQFMIHLYREANIKKGNQVAAL